MDFSGGGGNANGQPDAQSQNENQNGQNSQPTVGNANSNAVLGRGRGRGRGARGVIINPLANGNHHMIPTGFAARGSPAGRGGIINVVPGRGRRGRGGPRGRGVRGGNIHVAE